MEETIDNEIKELMENFIDNEIQNMIDNNNFKSISEIEKKKFGDYNIRVVYNNIQLYYKNNTFDFPTYNNREYRKTFFGFEYGKTIKNKTSTRVGDIRSKYSIAYSNYKEIIDNKDKIDALPDNIRKNILRKRKFKNII